MKTGPFGNVDDMEKAMHKEKIAKKKRWIYLLCVAALALFSILVAGCSSGDYKQPDENKTEESSIKQNETESSKVSFEKIPNIVSSKTLISFEEGDEVDVSDLGLQNCKIVKRKKLNFKDREPSYVYIIGEFTDVLKDKFNAFLAVEYEEKLFLGEIQNECLEIEMNIADVDNDRTDEIIIHQMIDCFGGAGQYISLIIKFSDNQFFEMFHSGTDEEFFSSGFSSEFLKDKKIKITNKFFEYQEVFDLSQRYDNSFFTEEGKGRFGELICDDFFYFYPEDVDNDNFFEIVGWQYASLTNHADGFGYAKSVLRYNLKTGVFDVVDGEFLFDSVLEMRNS